MRSLRPQTWRSHTAPPHQHQHHLNLHRHHHQTHITRSQAIPVGNSVDYSHLLDMELGEMMAVAAKTRDASNRGNIITFSPKVFIPLTRLCRDTCGYCTFAQPPRPGKRAFMTLDEVLAVAAMGAESGCAEVLFTLGDKPEHRWPEAQQELEAMGYPSTLEYVHAVALAVYKQTGLLPHINAGVMGIADILRLKEVSASQGLMLESTSLRLMEPGGPHHGCEDKHPAARLATIEAAGVASVPYTTGLLIGIGEARMERLETLLAILDLHQRHGHIAEVIIQNFRAKLNTAMANSPEPSLEELLWTVAAARIILGPDVNIQAPPNLSPSESEDGLQRLSWEALLDAGISDWGGISPITADYVNPEKAWPHLSALAEATASRGFHLLPRLPIYPEYLPMRGRRLLGVGEDHDQQQQQQQQGLALGVDKQRQLQHRQWLHDGGGSGSISAAVLRHMDSSGYLRGSSWSPGMQDSMAEATAAANDKAAVAPSMPDPQNLSNQVPASASSIPLPNPHASKVWSVRMRDDGTVQGCLPPPPNAAIAELLQRVLFMLPASDSETNSNLNSNSNSDPNGSRSGTAGIPVRCVDVAGVPASPNPLSEDDISLLLTARGADYHAVCAAANRVRQAVNGDVVAFVVNRNINYTNVCTFKCSFCAFSKGKASEELRGPAYLLPMEEITRRTAEAWGRGATEVCMQGGIHPDFTGETYLAILAAAKKGAPEIHIHAFSPLEVYQGASTLGLPLTAYLTMLRDAGLGSLPGTAAEVLHDDVRAVLCPDKLNTSQWIEVVSAAHAVGLPTTSTIMAGHVESQESWARHLVLLRELQMKSDAGNMPSSSASHLNSARISEFVPLPFVHMEAPVYLKGGSRKGPTLRECVLLHAVARLALHPHITNIQASWVKMGPEKATALLNSGCNDMGGVLMNESITRAAGASHGQELDAQRMNELIRAVGRSPVQRTTLYGVPPGEQVRKALEGSKSELAPLRMR